MLSPECCTIPQVASDYHPKGSLDEVDGLKIYHIGPTNTAALIAVYDVFGFHDNTKQFCDLLSSALHVPVVMPDFFRGSQRPENREEMQVWIQQVGNWEKVKKDLDLTLSYLRDKGASKFGILGFCWGAKTAIDAVKNDSPFSAAAAVHPSGKLVTDDAKEVHVPVALLPAKTDSDMQPFMDILEKSDNESFKKSVHRRFDDMHHGFAAARGNWADPLNAQRANEALEILVAFFKNTVVN